jgi:membrane protease YdiL (CAAX protease family)
MSTGPVQTEQPSTPAPQEESRVPLWIAPAALVLGLAFGFVATIVVELVGQAFGSSPTHPSHAVNVISNFFFDFSFVGAAMYFLLVQRRRDLRGFLGYRRIPLSLGVGSVVLAALAYYIVTLVYGALVSINETDKLPSELGAEHSTAALVAASIFVCVVAPIAEEFFFRGFLFGILRQMRVPWLGKNGGNWLAAVMVGLLFGLAHFDSAQPAFLIPLGFFGFVLCLLRWKTRSLYPGMALHSLNNCIALGVNELAWGAGSIVLICIGALMSIMLITLPLSRPMLHGAS